MLSPFQIYYIVQNSYSWPFDRCLKGLSSNPFPQFSSTPQMRLAHPPVPLPPHFESSTFVPIIVSPDDDKCKYVIGSTKIGPNKKKQKLYEHARKFQDVWTIHSPWVELMFDDKGQVH